MASRHRALDRGPHPAHATPSRAIRAYTAATNEDILSTCVRVLKMSSCGAAVAIRLQYAVGSDRVAGVREVQALGLVRDDGRPCLR